jgi:hypothetical protein
MPLPSSGPLSLNDIQTEFGGTNPISLSEYYAGGANVPAGTTGTFGAVPTIGNPISIRNFYGTSKIVYRLDSGTYSDFAVSPLDAQTTLFVGSDGSLDIGTFNSGVLANYNWITPTATASTHFVRLTPTSGTFSGSTTSAWLALTTSAQWFVNQTGFGLNTATGTLAISTNSGGTNIVATATITLRAQVDI